MTVENVQAAESTQAAQPAIDFADVWDALPESSGDDQTEEKKADDEESGDPVAPEQDTADTEEQLAKAQDSEGVNEGDEPESEEGEPVEAEEAEGDLNGDGESAPEELEKGYLRQQDYTKKTAELAEERRAFEAEAAGERQKVAARLKELDAALEAFNPIPRLIAQYQEAMQLGDVEEANRLRLDIRDAQDAKKRVESEMEQMQREDDAKEESGKQEFLSKQRETLGQLFPFLSDSKRHASFHETMRKSLDKVGFTEQELKAIDKPDARHAALAYYAGLYLKGQESKPEVAQALKGKVVTPKPGARPSDSGKGARQSEAIRKFDPNKAGSLANVFNAFDMT